MLAWLLVSTSVGLLSASGAFVLQGRVRKLNSMVFNRLQEMEARVELVRTHFMKILHPIRQNAEDIDALDDDLSRLEQQVRELKKRVENPHA